MLKWAKCGQGPTSRGTVADENGPEGPVLPANVEGQDEGEGWVGRVREDPDRGAALAGLAVEREQAGVEAERSLGRHEDARVELSPPDQGRSTFGEGVAGVERTQSTPRTDGQPVGVKGTPVGEFEAYLPDAREGNRVRRPDEQY